MPEKPYRSLAFVRVASHQSLEAAEGFLDLAILGIGPEDDVKEKLEDARKKIQKHFGVPI